MPKIEGREFTPTELRVVRMVLDQAIPGPKEACKAVQVKSISNYVNSRGQFPALAEYRLSPR